MENKKQVYILNMKPADEMIRDKKYLELFDVEEHEESEKFRMKFFDDYVIAKMLKHCNLFKIEYEFSVDNKCYFAIVTEL